MLEVVVIPFDEAVQAGPRSIVGHSRHSGARVKRANPESSSTHCLWIPGSRQEARPGMTAMLHVSTNPVLDPLAAESLRPWGKPK